MIGKIKNPKAPNGAPLLSELEADVIGLFVQLSHVLGLPRSFAEIYGLLFISSRPLAMDDVIGRLNISKGSASQGLKFLRTSGAVKVVYVAGDRRVHYEAVAELRNLAGRFLRDQIVPQVDGGLTRIDNIAGKVERLPENERERISSRITMLQSWGKKSREFLPVVAALLEA